MSHPIRPVHASPERSSKEYSPFMVAGPMRKTKKNPPRKPKNGEKHKAPKPDKDRAPSGKFIRGGGGGDYRLKPTKGAAAARG